MRLSGVASLTFIGVVTSTQLSAMILEKPSHAVASAPKPKSPPPNQGSQRIQGARLAKQPKPKPPPPPDRGAPGDTQGAASRGLCPPVNTVLTALMPTFKTAGEEDSVWGLTISEYPTFWFFVPYSLTSKITGEFILQDENQFIQSDEDTLYKTKIPLTTAETSPGVISLRLPSTVAPLEIGKRYYWKFIVHCHPQDPSANIYVDGWVERTALSPSLMRDLKKMVPIERAALYYQAGIWYDSLTTLAELRRASPQDAELADDWTALLQIVDLAEIASKPIVQCCTPER